MADALRSRAHRTDAPRTLRIAAVAANAGPVDAGLAATTLLEECHA